ncbi:MAG: peptidoglycan-binding protein [Myxococcales bacterium]|nr:peptidoglycan-binding protein [Myxococcales bacterium]MCB9544512.1 peptidoglycan-binding protein [Myxococcales bacterium]
MGRWLNLELLDSTGTPFRQRPFSLHWAGGGVDGTTAPNGLISLEIPAGVETATLRVAWREFTLDFRLPPADDVAGAQARLNQLNFFSGKVDGDLGPKTRQAIERFQRAHHLDPTGALDAATAQRLAEEHGT